MPQLDILSFPSQLFWLCVVFFFGLFISLRYILPSVVAVLYGRKFFLSTKYNSSKSNLGVSLVTNYITRLNTSLDESLNIDFNTIESFPESLLNIHHTKIKNAEKAFLSPFFFFSVSDTQILLIAFIISFSCLFVYFYNTYTYDSKQFPKPHYLKELTVKTELPKISNLFIDENN